MQFYKIQRADGMFYTGPRYSRLFGEQTKWVGDGGKVYKNLGLARRAVTSGRRPNASRFGPNIRPTDEIEIVEYTAQETSRIQVPV